MSNNDLKEIAEYEAAKAALASGGTNGSAAPAPAAAASVEDF